MYLKLIYSFSLIFVTKINGQLDVGNSTLLRQNTNKCDLTAHPQCSSDCSTILLCYAGIENPIFSIKCPSDTPYCENGRCAAAPGSCSLKSDNSQFVCTSAGIFPDPSDCSKYHNCPDGGGTSIPEECPTENIFNSKLKMCVRGEHRADHQSRKICQKISCDGVTNDFILFPANPAFYAYCFISAAGKRQTYMYKCDDGKVFDMKTKMCRFNCKSVGYFADPVDCNAYYICNRRGSRFSPRQIHCPPNYYFNGTACLNSDKHCPPESIITTTTTTTTAPSPQMADDTNTGVTDMATEYTTAMNTEIVSESTQMQTETTTDADIETTQMNMNDPTSLPTDVVTSVPFKSAIWKHMGRFSVRIGRFFNFI